MLVSNEDWIILRLYPPQLAEHANSSQCIPKRINISMLMPSSSVTGQLVTRREGRLGSEAGMDVRMAAASGRSAVSKASCAAVKHTHPDRAARAQHPRF